MCWFKTGIRVVVLSTGAGCGAIDRSPSLSLSETSAPARRCHVSRHAQTMCWRRVSKFQKTVFIVILYTIIYFSLSLVLTPEPIYNFISDDMQGNKYALIYLVGKTPAFSDSEGADAFKKRQCGDCFLSNNKGFLPLRDYDAVLIFGDEDASVFIEPDKRYYLETSEDCLRRKLLGCDVRVTSYSSRKEYDLCGLCRNLQSKRGR